VTQVRLLQIKAGWYNA